MSGSITSTFLALRGMAFAKRLYPLPSAPRLRSARSLPLARARYQRRAWRPRGAILRRQACGSAANVCAAVTIFAKTSSAFAVSTVDGWAQDLTNHPARLMVKIPDAVALQDAACVAVAYSTVEHMLLDNARLEPGETILIHVRRLRHRHHRGEDREIHRLHRHHHGRQQR